MLVALGWGFFGAAVAQDSPSGLWTACQELSAKGSDSREFGLSNGTPIWRLASIWSSSSGPFRSGDTIQATLAPGPESPEATEAAWSIVGDADDPQSSILLSSNSIPGVLTYTVPAGESTDIAMFVESINGGGKLTVNCIPPPPPTCAQATLEFPIEWVTQDDGFAYLDSLLAGTFVTAAPGDTFKFTLQPGIGDKAATEASWHLFTFDPADYSTPDLIPLPSGKGVLGASLTYTATEAGIVPLFFGIRDEESKPTIDGSATMVMTCTPAPTASAQLTPVPTVGEWGLMLMGLLVAGVGARQMRRKL